MDKFIIMIIMGIFTGSIITQCAYEFSIHSNKKSNLIILRPYILIVINLDFISSYLNFIILQYNSMTITDNAEL